MPDMADVHIYGGLACVAVGCGLINLGAGLIALGLGLIALGLLYGLRAASTPPDQES